MRRFIQSRWLSITTICILIGVTTASYAMFNPMGYDITNAKIVKTFTMIGWGTGLLFGILSLILCGVLSLLRKMFRLRGVFALHAPLVFLSIFPWVLLSWQFAGEPRYMNIARALIDFVARPLLWGSLAACTFAAVVSLIAFFLPAKK